MAGAAGASYELGLALINGVGVVRFDTISGAYLGSFLPSTSSPLSMSLDPTQPGTVVIAMDGGNTFGYIRYNYSTGVPVEIKQTLNTSSYSSAKVLGNGNLAYSAFVSGTRRVEIMTPNLVLLRALTLNSATSQIVDIAESSTGNIAVLTRRPGTNANTHRFEINMFTSSGTTAATTTLVADNTLVDSYSSLDLMGTNLLVGGDNSLACTLFSLNGTAISNKQLTQGTVRNGGRAAWGHGGTMHHFGYHNGTSMSLMTTNSINLSWNNPRTIGSPLGGVIDFDVVVAPEPTTVILLGAGLGSFLVRRRKA